MTTAASQDGTAIRTPPKATRRRFLAGLGLATVGAALGVGRATGSQHLAGILTGESGVWVHEPFGSETSFGPAAPEVRSRAVWRFQRQSGLQDGFDGFGTRDIQTILPNGTVAATSTPGLANSFVWDLTGNTLTTRFTSLTGSVRTETWTLAYDERTDSFAMSNPTWGQGTMRRWEVAFREDEQFGGAPSYEYTTVTSAADVIRVDLPTAWADVQTAAQEGTVYLAAAPSIAQFNQSLAVPGALVFVTPGEGATPAAVLEYLRIQERGCTFTSVEQYQTAGEPSLSGGVYRYNGCGGTLVSMLHVAAQDPATDLLVIGMVRMVDAADREAGQRLLDTLQVTVQ